MYILNHIRMHIVQTHTYIGYTIYAYIAGPINAHGECYINAYVKDYINTYLHECTNAILVHTLAAIFKKISDATLMHTSYVRTMHILDDM